MAILQAHPQPVAPPAGARDAGIDLARAACVVIVVLLHAVMVGVTVGPEGVVFANASDGAAWFAPLTWFVQIMPLFFVIGGFAGSLSFRRSRSRGATAAGFVAGRIHRLLLPAAVAIAAAGVGLGLLTLAGVPAEHVLTAGFRFSQPLWFLAVFLLCQALLPAFVAAHERRPWLTIASLAGGAVAVDVVRAATGADAVGILNLAFVWLAMQQVGLFLADGTLGKLPRWAAAATGAGALALLGLLVAGGAYSGDMLQNLNPPTAALLLLGAAQTMLLTVLRGPLARLSRRPRVAAVTAFVTARTMTVYLWHMPVLLAMAGVCAVVALQTGLVLPEPSSGAWWATRPLWFAFALALTAGVAVVCARAERVRVPHAAASARRLVTATVLGIAAPVLLLVTGTTVVTAAVAAALAALALRTAFPTAGRERPRLAAAVSRR